MTRAVDALLAAIERGRERAAGSGRPEAILREEVQPVLRDLLVAGGARSVAHDEVRLAVPPPSEAHELDAPLIGFGRADAIYNRFVIEFEPPGSLRPSVMHSATRHAVAQVQQYLRGLAEHTRLPLDRLAGCAFDGGWIVYVTWERGAWVVSRPRPADADAITALIQTLVSLASGRGLTADNLDEDFGRSSNVARSVVGSLVRLFESGEISARGRAMFAQWSVDLGESAGEFSARDISEWADLCRGLGVSPRESVSAEVLFCVHTYFALVAKLLALVVLDGATGSSLVDELHSIPESGLGFRFLESGELTALTRTRNVIEPGIFSWYAMEHSPDLLKPLKLMLAVAREYSAEIVEITPLVARDVLKDLYQRLVPRSIRHRLGEYYTPDWLAQRVINQVVGPAMDLDPRRRVLDPACGSGTFLVEVISRMLRSTAADDPERCLELITQNVVGFDLSPLAVQAAKVNYLLALAPVLKRAEMPIFLPVFLADSVSPPRSGGLLEGDVFVLRSSEGDWRVPTVLAQARYLPELGAILQEALRSGASGAQVRRLVVERVPLIAAEDAAVIDAVIDLYAKLVKLDAADRDGMWWHLISNAFAPTLQGRFDFVVGNPPWVSWETLPEHYRRSNEDQWDHYGLRPTAASGRRQSSSNARLDLSMLFVAKCVDRYLVENGRLGFVITATVFKSELAGRGFRKRLLPPNSCYSFAHIDDMTLLSVFEGAANQTAVLVVSRHSDQGSVRPVPVTLWTGVTGRSLVVPWSTPLDRVSSLTSRRNLMAEPVDPSDPCTPLLMMPRGALFASRSLRRRSAYMDAVREGINTRGANGVFFVELIREEAELVLVRNLAAEGRNEVVETVEGFVERRAIAKLLRGADVSRGVAKPSAGLLLFHDLDHTSASLPIDEVKTRFPRAFEFISHFKGVLTNRRAFRNFDPSGSGWLGIYSVTPAALAEHKVVVREVAQGMIAAPVHGSEVVPDHKLHVIACQGYVEAELLARVLCLPIVDLMIRSFALGTSITGSFLRYIGIRDLSSAERVTDEPAVMAAALGLPLDDYETLDTIARRELSSRAS